MAQSRNLSQAVFRESDAVIAAIEAGRSLKSLKWVTQAEHSGLTRVDVSAFETEFAFAAKTVRFDDFEIDDLLKG